MDRYKAKKIKGNNWVGLYQGSLNWKNCFIFHWCWINSQMHPSTRFGVTILGFVLPKIERHRSLFSLNWYTWNAKKAGYLSISVLWLPSFDFRIGDEKTWLCLRCENIYAYQCSQHNKRSKIL